MFNLHLKSRLKKRNDDPQSHYFRQGEARAVSEYIDQTYPLNQKPLYLITGDLNDTTRSKTVKTLCGYRKKKKAALVNRFDYFIASMALQRKIKEDNGFIIKGAQGSDHRMVYIDLVFE